MLEMTADCCISVSGQCMLSNLNSLINYACSSLQCRKALCFRAVPFIRLSLYPGKWYYYHNIS